MSSQSSRRRIEAVDHISNLPDSIILHILSFLRTKSAVKTSILSKRWRYMWTKVPVLDFTEMPRSKFYESLKLQQRFYFKNFVDRVLLHNDVSYVQRLYLNLTQGDDDFYLKSWLSALTRREFREIKIMLEFSLTQLEPIVLPTTFLSSKRLVVLKLCGNFAINATLTLHLPNLEIVHLTGLQLPNDEFVKRLSSDCRVLREMHISDCDGITSKLYVESLTLMRLEIDRTMDKCKSLQNPCIVIKAPNLRYLRLDDVPTEYDICDLSSLVEAYLDICFDDDDDDTLQLLRKISGVKTLRFGTAGWFGCVSKPPIFENLTCLMLESDRNTYKLVDCSPKLKSLTFELVLYGEISFARSIPKCLSCLERVEFNSFEGEEEELSFIAYFLKAASVLKEAKINMFGSRSCKKHVYEKLLMLPRSSAACQVKIHSPDI